MIVKIANYNISLVVHHLVQAEEAKLITQLAEMDAINYQLFKQAYNTSVDVSKFLDHYEMSKHLTGPYDMEGACIVIRAGSEGTNSEVELRECPVF